MASREGLPPGGATTTRYAPPDHGTKAWLACRCRSSSRTANGSCRRCARITASVNRTPAPCSSARPSKRSAVPSLMRRCVAPSRISMTWPNAAKAPAVNGSTCRVTGAAMASPPASLSLAAFSNNRSVSDEPTRLSKVVASLVPCSRREAEQYIAEGRVRVDGQLVDEPQFRVAGQRVEIDRKSQLQPALPATLLLHKPAGMGTAQALASIGAATRWTEDTSGVVRVKSHAAGLIDLLPLPPPASGLAVFSQDGRIVRKLQED